MTPLKKLAWGGLSLLPPLFFLVYYAWLPADTPATGDEHATATDRTPMAGGHEIRGFTYQYDRGGHKIITIRADRLSIRKMKMGFFRFSLLHEPLLENGLIQLHDRRLPASATDAPDHPTSALGQLFSKEILPDLPVKRITAVAIRPVVLELFNDTGTITTRISADSAVIRFSRREVRFNGNVRVISGPRELLTSRLRLSAEERLLTTERPFVLKDPEGQSRGRELTADFLLQPARKEDNLPR